jgi:protein-L-isoaspartate(D-aspartate) O-methyltransferase
MEVQQEILLNLCRSKYKLSKEIIEAYIKCPRHKFVSRSFSMEEIYADHPLPLFEDSHRVSTISQPSFVMRMIDLLDLKPFHKVLELGAGSGWNAALMSCLVEKVVTIEIIPGLAQETRERLKHLSFMNVEVIQGDGAHGFLPEAPYDRGIFTAGATDLPKAFHQQMKSGGKLLFVLKGSDMDYLLLLVKTADGFEELMRLPCSFVPMTGEKEAKVNPEVNALMAEGRKLKIRPNSESGGMDSVFSVA